MRDPLPGTGRTGARSAAPRRERRSHGTRAAWLLAPWLALASCSSAKPQYLPVLTLDDSQASYGQVTLRWTYGGPLREGYWIEVKEGDTDWRVLRILPASLRPHWSDYPVSFDATSAETRYAFRMQAYSPTETSGYGNEVEFFWIRPPAITTFAHTDDTLWSVGDYELAWARQSLLPTEERLERSVEALDGSAGPWVSLPVPPGATSYEDTDLSARVDGARYRYRVVSRFGAHQMASALSVGDPGPVAPAAASAAIVRGLLGVRLSWTMRSAVADGVDIYRDGIVHLGRFPSGVSSAYDPAPTGAHLYTFASTDSAHQWVPPGTAELAVLVPDPGWSSPLLYSTALTPGGDAAVRDSAGAFAFAQEVSGTLSVPEGSRWTGYRVAARFFEPYLLIDRGDAVHALYCDESTAYLGYGQVRHLWVDGGGMHDELVDPGTVAQAYRGLVAVADDGSLRGAWVGSGAMTFGTNAGGGWTLDVLPLAAGSSALAMAIEPSGSSQILVCADGPCDMWRRDATGSWTADAVPAATPPVGGNVRLLAPADGASLLAYDEVPAFGDRSVWIIERDAGGWRDPVRLGNGSVDTAALSPDRARIAIGARDPPAQLFLRDSGSWQAIPLLFDSWRRLATGFTPAGKAWVLGGLGGEPPYVLYQEP